MHARRRSLWWLAVFGVACGGGPAPEEATEVVAVARPAVAGAPDAAEWTGVPELRAALLLQDMVEPRLLERSTPEVRVKAMTDGRLVAFRLEWPDATRDDVPDTGRFSDACAVQLPARATADVPAPQMGEAGRSVDITLWRASWQAMVDGRPDSVAVLHPGASVDHYPFEAPSLATGSPEQQAMALRYAPARALGNVMAGPREKPVQDLVADGPGTLRPTDATRSNGRGARGAQGWAVVLVRPLPTGLPLGARSNVAFAVWDGAHGEAGARKMRTGWVPLLLEATP